MHLTFTQTPEGPSLFGWPDELLADWPANASLLVLGDPFTFPADLLLDRVNEEHPGVPVFGGMASGSSTPGENRLLLGRQALEDGAVAVLFHGARAVRTVVSQGCRPIGKPFVITRAERNVIQKLGGQPALVQLNAVYQTLATREQDLVRNGLHVGRVVSEYQEQFEIGDFLVRNVIGMDPRSGAIAIGDWVRVGQTVQFHVRDWETAAADLDQLLGRVKRDPAAAPGGALLFTCNGRGTRLFPHPHHDAGVVVASWATCRWPAFSPKGNSGPWAARTSSTVLPLAWRCSNQRKAGPLAGPVGNACPNAPSSSSRKPPRRTRSTGCWRKISSPA